MQAGMCEMGNDQSWHNKNCKMIQLCNFRVQKVIQPLSPGKNLMSNTFFIKNFATFEVCEDINMTRLSPLC